MEGLSSEILSKILSYLTTGELFTMRLINRLYYRLYYSDTLWLAKYRGDHQIEVVDLRGHKNYRQLYYNTNRAHIWIYNSPTDYQYIDLKMFARKVVSDRLTDDNYGFYIIDLDYNLWDGGFLNGKIQYLTLIKTNVYDIVIGINNCYLDKTGCVRSLNTDDVIFKPTESNKKIKSIFNFGVNIGAVCLDGEIVWRKVNNFRYSSAVCHMDYIIRNLNDITKKYGVRKIYSGDDEEIIVLDSNDRLWILRFGIINNTQPKLALRKIDNVLDFTQISVYLMVIEKSGNIITFKNGEENPEVLMYIGIYDGFLLENTNKSPLSMIYHISDPYFPYLSGHSVLDSHSNSPFFIFISNINS